MSRNGTRLDVTQPPDLADSLQAMIEAWPQVEAMGVPSPRSKWLGSVERLLAHYHPQASSADRRLTARGLAPFPLRDGPNVP